MASLIGSFIHYFQLCSREETSVEDGLRLPHDDPRGLQDGPRGPQGDPQEGFSMLNTLFFIVFFQCVSGSRLFGLRAAKDGPRGTQIRPKTALLAPKGAP